MALEWVAFNLEAYTGDTSHLTCEEHGAYLLLMLAYYRSEKPLPATDRALSSICKLPLDRWLECKPALAPFFVYETEQSAGPDGEFTIHRWRHTRIEQEIKAGHERIARFSQRGKKANAERHKHPSSVHDGANKEPSGDQDGADKSHTLTLTKDSLSLLSTDDQVPGADEPVVEASTVPEIEDRPSPQVERPLTPINPQYRPPAAIEAECKTWMDPSAYHIEWQKFVFDAREKGKLSADWDASFQKWIERFREFSKRPPARGKPRVQLTPDPPAPDAVKINWDWHLTRWLKNESSWSRRTAGPEPGQPGCRVPSEMFLKHGINPLTGRKERETT
jgi:uncharacterized protein YdaU (DUF1376 family)